MAERGSQAVRTPHRSRSDCWWGRACRTSRATSAAVTCGNSGDSGKAALEVRLRLPHDKGGQSGKEIEQPVRRSKPNRAHARWQMLARVSFVVEAESMGRMAFGCNVRSKRQANAEGCFEPAYIEHSNSMFGRRRERLIGKCARSLPTELPSLSFSLSLMAQLGWWVVRDYAI